MGLFNHLFKPRHDEPGEKTVDDNPSPADGENPAIPATPTDALSPDPATPNPSAFLQPKDFIHRGATQALAPTRFAQPLRQPERRGALPSEPPREIVLSLGDILSHVPTQFLKTGMHDAKRELRFATDELTSDIARGRPTVLLSKIAVQCPDVFDTHVDTAGIQIRLPLQKLLDQLGLYTPRAVSPPARILAPVEERTAEPLISFDGKPEPAEQLIHLRLAAILAHCPDELFIGERPLVDESVRVGLPFAPIERQLISGRVEISALRFVALLPSAYAQHFVAREGLKVPLPLDEIFRNLPGGSISDPAFETPSPVVNAQTAPASQAPVLNEPELPVVSGPMPEAVAPVAELPTSVAVAEAPLPATQIPALAPFAESLAPADVAPPPAPATEASTFEPEVEAPAPVSEPAISIAKPASAAASLGPLLPVRMFIRPPPVLGLAQKEVAAATAEMRPVEEIAAAPVEVPRVAAAVPQIAPVGVIVEPSNPIPMPLAPKVNVQPPPRIRPVVILPPPVIASATREPLREMSSLVPPPFVFTAPPLQAAEVKAVVDHELGVSVPSARPSPPPVFNLPPVPVTESASVGASLDQDALQALFMTDETLDLPKLACLAAALPGVEACVLIVRGDTVQYGHLPIEARALAEMAPRFVELRALGPVACVTVNAAQHSLSYFTRGDLCVCAIHGPRGFLPGVREKLSALADALA